MSAPAFVAFDSEKGGTGKSTAALSFVSWCAARGIRTRVIDADASNPDVLRLCSKLTQCELINVRDEGGWLRIAEIAEENAKHLRGGAIVLNLPSQVAHSFPDERQCMYEALRTLRFRSTLVWVLDTGVDTVNLLAGGMLAAEEFVPSKIALRNLRWGNRDDFAVWQNSGTREHFLTVGKEADFPRLWPPLADRLRLSGDASFLRDRGTPFGLAEFLTIRSWVLKTDDLWDSLRKQVLAA